ncbi:hypothetical protein [Streptomyces sp. NRRL S-350]|uniref:hypothetical protein n=1 Tax=Streptomyces sp. NRRL S-350 TaxID=1463902 RepID=UPI0004BF03AD|nr:hypothetical protein [Streptomyces sp. NRRL S-350]
MSDRSPFQPYVYAVHKDDQDTALMSSEPLAPAATAPAGSPAEHGLSSAIVWDDYPLLDSGDPAKHDLELIHTGCGQHLCDAESGDVLPTLLGMVTDHDAVCAGRRAER